MRNRLLFCSNYTLRHMPFPIYDIVPCMKLSAEKTENVMKKIQDILHRNVSPKRYSNGHAFRLQQVNTMETGDDTFTRKS